MLLFLLRRCVAIIPVLLGVSVAVFLMVRLLPGDVVSLILGTESGGGSAQAAQLRHVFGLDKPLYVQYFTWLGRLFVGDFGTSIRTGRPVLPDVLVRLPVTLQLAGMATILSVVIAVPLGVLSATRRGTARDGAIQVLGLVGLSLPNFWLATLLVLFISLYWRVLPTSGYVPLSHGILPSMRSLLLPSISLAMPNVAIIMRMTRSSLLEVLRQEYVNTARAKGLAERIVIRRHALRNALVPVVTVAGIQVGYLLGGAIVIEQIFALPGLGTLVLNAINQRDYPLLQAGTLCLAVAFPIVNLAVDALYGFLDPKLRHS